MKQANWPRHFWGFRGMWVRNKTLVIMYPVRMTRVQSYWPVLSTGTRCGGQELPVIFKILFYKQTKFKNLQFRWKRHSVALQFHFSSIFGSFSLTSIKELYLTLGTSGFPKKDTETGNRYPWKEHLKRSWTKCSYYQEITFFYPH